MGPKEFVPCIFCPWPLFSKQDLEERSPSRHFRDKEGHYKPMTRGKEQNLMKTTCELIRDAGAALKLKYSIPTAMMFARRYYSVKAMQASDRFIVVCACLFLAAKCEDESLALNDVCYQTYRIRYIQNPEALKNMSDVAFFNQFREIVLTAERSLLYALGFQLDIGHPYYWTSSILKRLSALPSVGEDWERYSKRTMQPRTFFINDIYRASNLMLRYDLRLIGLAVIHITLPIMYSDIGKPTANHDKVPLIDLQPWYSYVLKTERPEVPEGEASATPLRAGPSYVPEQPVTVSLLMEIGKEIMSLYGKTAGQAQAQGAAQPAKASVPEVVGPDGPITPEVEELGTPHSEASPDQGIAEGKQESNDAKAPSEAANASDIKAGLNPGAPPFVPAAAQPLPAQADVHSPDRHAAQQAVKQPSRKCSLDEAGLPEQASPAKRAVLEGSSLRNDDPLQSSSAAPPGSLGAGQPAAGQQSHNDGSSIPVADMEVNDPLASTAQAAPQCNSSTAPAAEPASKQSALANSAGPAGALHTMPSLADGIQSAPSNGAEQLHKQPSTASEEGELTDEIQALEDSPQPQAAPDPAAASQRLKKWQEAQKASGQAEQDDLVAELKAELEDLVSPEKPKQVRFDAAAIEAAERAAERLAERRKKWQQMQAAATQSAQANAAQQPLRSTL